MTDGVMGMFARRREPRARGVGASLRLVEALLGERDGVSRTRRRNC